jgi:HlyD family secretion protein
MRQGLPFPSRQDHIHVGKEKLLRQPGAANRIEGMNETDVRREEAATPGRPAGLDAEERAGQALLPVPVRLPVPVATPEAKRHRRLRPIFFLLLAVFAGIGGVVYWRLHLQPGLPPGFTFGNGRLEADEIDIETKFAGRIAEILADQGDVVKAGQVVARMDTRDLEAELGKAEAQIRQTEKNLEAARAQFEQQRSHVKLSEQELQRARFLVQKNFVSKELLDQRQQQMDGDLAALDATRAQIGQTEHALEAARQDAALIKVNIADNTLVAPKDGIIQYRLANIGEVLGAGGKAFTMLDTHYIYMDVFLPTADAGRVVLGADSRIVLDAMPGEALPAKVTFVAPEAQFTPKAVETREERDKLMFRIRVRIDESRLRIPPEEIRAGQPGLSYVRLDPAAAWPDWLQGRAGSSGS